MKNFKHWTISEALKNVDAEIYIEHDTMIRTEFANFNLDGRTIYTVIGVDEEEDTVTIESQHGQKLTVDRETLSKALSEDAYQGFQVMQYPLGAAFTSSGTQLANLSVYDPRLKKMLRK